VAWPVVKKLLELGSTSGLTDREFRVMWSLCDRVNAKTGQLNPSARRIALDIGLEPDRAAVRSVRRTLADLEAQGWFRRVGSSKGGRPDGRYRSQSYRLRGDLMSPLNGPRRVTQETAKGDTNDHLKGDLMSPEPRKLGTWEGEPSDWFHQSGRVPPEGNPTAPVHPYSRMRPFLVQVLAEDDGAEWVEGQGIRLESGKYLRTVQAARKFLESPGLGSW
jgi:Helix-turn-helix domain